MVLRNEAKLLQKINHGVAEQVRKRTEALNDKVI